VGRHNNIFAASQPLAIKKTSNLLKLQQFR